MGSGKNISDRQAAENEIAYIKAIMSKSELDHGVFGVYFMVLALYFFVSNIFAKPVIKAWVRRVMEDAVEGRVIVHVALPFSVCVWSIVTLIPLLLLLAFFHKKVKTNNRGISQWLFKIQAFLLVFCNGLLPVTSVIVSASEEAAELFSVTAASLILLVTSIFSGSKKLRIFSYAYVLVAIVLLTVLGIPNLYYDFLAESLQTTPPAFVYLYMSFQFLVYEISPVVAYMVLAGYMYMQGKGVGKDEF